MMQHIDDRKLVSKKGILLDLILSFIFLGYMYTVMLDHVPFYEGPLRYITALYCAAPLSGVFWLAVQCLRVTWVDQILNKK